MSQQKSDQRRQFCGTLRNKLEPAARTVKETRTSKSTTGSCVVLSGEMRDARNGVSGATGVSRRATTFCGSEKSLRAPQGHNLTRFVDQLNTTGSNVD